MEFLRKGHLDMNNLCDVIKILGVSVLVVMLKQEKN